MAEQIPCGADVVAVVDAVRRCAQPGFTHMALVQIGSDHQQPFSDWTGPASSRRCASAQVPGSARSVG